MQKQWHVLELLKEFNEWYSEIIHSGFNRKAAVRVAKKSSMPCMVECQYITKSGEILDKACGPKYYNRAWRGKGKRKCIGI